jgi:hypothetical protein
MTSHLPPPPDDLDPIIEAAITLILARYAAVIPPSMLDGFRRSLRFGMASSPRRSPGFRTRPSQTT